MEAHVLDCDDDHDHDDYHDHGDDHDRHHHMMRSRQMEVGGRILGGERSRLGCNDRMNYCTCHHHHHHHHSDHDCDQDDCNMIYEELKEIMQ